MSSSKNLEFEKSGFLTKSNSAFIEQMYLQYLNNDPNLTSNRGKKLIELLYLFEKNKAIDFISAG